MRVAIRVYIEGVLHSEERVDVTKGTGMIRALAEKHARKLAKQTGHIEIEFLDEPNPNERFLRLGTDPRYMVSPVRLNAR